MGASAISILGIPWVMSRLPGPSHLDSSHHLLHTAVPLSTAFSLCFRKALVHNIQTEPETHWEHILWRENLQSPFPWLLSATPNQTLTPRRKPTSSPEPSECQARQKTAPTPLPPLCTERAAAEPSADTSENPSPYVLHIRP